MLWSVVRQALGPLLPLLITGSLSPGLAQPAEPNPALTPTATTADQLEQLQRLERELEASRQRLAEQQERINAEQSQQQRLADELAALRARITGTAVPQVPAAAADPAAPVATAPPRAR